MKPETDHRVMMRRPTSHNLLIIKRNKKRIGDFVQKYSSMILIGYEGP